jgi:hypothetical protein
MKVKVSLTVGGDGHSQGLLKGYEKFVSGKGASQTSRLQEARSL